MFCNCFFFSSVSCLNFFIYFSIPSSPSPASRFLTTAFNSASSTEISVFKASCFGVETVLEVDRGSIKAEGFGDVETVVDTDDEGTKAEDWSTEDSVLLEARKKSINLHGIRTYENIHQKELRKSY